MADVKWRDVLARKEAEHPGAQFRALMDMVDDGFCIIQFVDGPDGPLSDYIHIEANSGCERHTGIPDLKGKSVFDVAPEDARDWVRIYGQVLDTGEPIRFEREFREAGRHVEVSATRVGPAGAGQVAVLFRDITERKRTEAALRESQRCAEENARRVQLALSAGAIVGTWTWELDDEVFILDDGFTAAMGLEPALPRQGLSVERIAANVHPDDLDDLMAAIRRTVAGGHPYAHQFRVLREDGAYHWVEANGRIEEGSPRIFAGVLMDLDERRAVAEERDRATEALFRLNQTLEDRVAEQTALLMAREEDLRQAQKMEAVGQLTGGLAHDFNNLLAAITGSLDLVTARLRQGRLEDLPRLVEAAQAAAARAAVVTQRLLAFSRRQPLAPQPTDVPALVSGMNDLIRQSVGSAIAVTVAAEPGAWPAMVDGNQLENALLNLCINARDAMPGAGTLHIDIANRRIDDHACLAPGDYLRLAVSDTGSGMTPDLVARAFDPYFTTKPSGKGTGLGLSMVFGFVRQSGGHVGIISTPGEGTTVEMFLPRSSAAASAAGAPPAGQGATGGAGQTVLVVGDEVLVRMVVADALMDAGFAVAEAGTAAEALAVLAERPEISVLLTDVGLPGGMTGRHLALRALERNAELRVMFMTGYDEEATSVTALADAGMLQKPFSFETLVSRVAELAARAPRG